jgi:heat-inducible transcriptional repressor
VTRRVRTAGSLDPRSQSILRAVIEEYVDSATPVGSAALVQRYRLGVSSATVRNILSDLEEAGLLTHPHTSAGRVPTDAGYRYFVESIGDSAILPPVEQLMIRHQFGQVQHASEQWFRLAATILAAANRTAAIVTPAKPRTAHVRRIDIVSISDRLASLIIVFREGAVRQVLVTLSATTEQEDLTRAAVVLDGIMAGRTAADAERALARIDATAPIGALVELVGQRVLAAVRDYDSSPIEEVFSDGLLHVMDAPEFDRSDKLRQVFAPREPLVPRRPVRLDRRERPGRCSSAPRTAPTRCATSRSSSPRTASPAGPSASSACSGRRGWPTARRSAPSASSRA